MLQTGCQVVVQVLGEEFQGSWVGGAQRVLEVSIKDQ